MHICMQCIAIARCGQCKCKALIHADPSPIMPIHWCHCCQCWSHSYIYIVGRNISHPLCQSTGATVVTAGPRNGRNIPSTIMSIHCYHWYPRTKIHCCHCKCIFWIQHINILCTDPSPIMSIHWCHCCRWSQSWQKISLQQLCQSTAISELESTAVSAGPRIGRNIALLVCLLLVLSSTDLDF